MGSGNPVTALASHLALTEAAARNILDERLQEHS